MASGATLRQAAARDQTEQQLDGGVAQEREADLVDGELGHPELVERRSDSVVDQAVRAVTGESQPG